jgi:uncharacterized protein (TIGR04255 family)
MVLNLAEPDRRELATSPLVLTVCQVRFEETLAVADARVILRIQEMLAASGAGAYPKIDQVKGPALQFSVSSEEGSEESRSLPQVAGWRLQSEDGAWIASIMPDFAALETSRYTTWEADFGPRVGALIEAVQTYVEPALEERLGLRYVDRLTALEVKEPPDWTRYLDASLLGVLLHDTLGRAVASTQQQIDLDLGQDVRCILRHGHPSGGEDGSIHTYVLDYDIYRQSARAFDANAIKQTLEHFSDAALQLFHASLNPEYLGRLREGVASALNSPGGIE